MCRHAEIVETSRSASRAPGDLAGLESLSRPSRSTRWRNEPVADETRRTDCNVNGATPQDGALTVLQRWRQATTWASNTTYRRPGLSAYSTAFHTDRTSRTKSGPDLHFGRPESLHVIRGVGDRWKS